MNKTISLATLALCLGFTACTDDWDDHYEASATAGGSLWQAIQSTPELSNFARVAAAAAFDTKLDGSQTYTVFAPTDEAFTSAEADAMIASYQEQAQAGVRPADNTVVRQFLQNHIALYRYPVSSLTADTIAMMNDKRVALTSTAVAGVPFADKNQLAANGLLFTMPRQLTYFPNVYEYLGHDADLDSVHAFLAKHSNYEFDEYHSVPGEIRDGITHYLDSVSILRNDLLLQMGDINSEDSTYYMLAPTNAEWSRLLAEYEPYFNYANTTAKRDSMVYTNTRSAILAGSIFSRTTNPQIDTADSLTATWPYEIKDMKIQGPRFPRSIFDGTTDVVCSNGHVKKSAAWGISKYDTFLKTIKVEAEDIVYQDTLIDAIDPLIVHQVKSDNPFFGQISGDAFVEVAPVNPTAKVLVGFKIPNLLAGVPYNIYAVFVPATAADTMATEEATKPNIVLCNLRKTDQYGNSSLQRFRQAKRNNPAVVDTLEMATNVVLPTCSYGLQEPQVKFEIQSNVQSSQTATNSTTLRLDCIIFKPTELTK